MATLAAIVDEFLFLGLPSGIVLEIIKSVWAKCTRKPWSSLYIQSMQEAIASAKPILKKYSDNNEVSLDNRAIRAVINLDLGISIDSVPFSVMTSAGVKELLAKSLCKSSAVIIGGNNLSDHDYFSLVSMFVDLVEQNITKTISNDEALFRHAMLMEAKSNYNNYMECLDYLQNRFGGLENFCQNIMQEITSTREQLSVQTEMLQRIMDGVSDIGKELIPSNSINLLENLVERYNVEHNPFRCQIVQGEGEPPKLEGAFASQSTVVEKESNKFIAVYFFERYTGALTDFPVKFKFDLEFPNTPEGEESQRQWTDAFDKGTPATIESSYIKNFVTNLPTLIGKPQRGAKYQLQILPAIPSDKTFLFRVELGEKFGEVKAELPAIHLKIERSGRKEALLSNRHLKSPLATSILIGISGSFNFKFDCEGYTPQEVIAHVKFVDCLHSASWIRITDTGNNLLIADSDIRDLKGEYVAMFPVFNALCYIADALAIDLVLPKLSEFTESDVENIFYAYKILMDRKREIKVSDMRFSVDIETAKKLTQIGHGNYQLRVGPFEDTVEIFGNNICIGSYHVVISEDAFNHIDYLAIEESISNGVPEVSISLEGLDIKATCYYIQGIDL